MSLVMAIFLTLLASVLARSGIVLLKQAVARAEGRWLTVALIRSGRALLGMLLQAVGIGLFLLALQSPHAPISILQPMRAFGIVIMAFLAVIFLHEKLCALEWLGIGLSVLGFILLTCSYGERPAAPDTIDRLRLTILIGACGLLAVLAVGVLSIPGLRFAEALFGSLAGIFLGIGYLHAKVIFLAWRAADVPMLALSALLIVSGLLGGLAVLLLSFRKCRALIVTTVNLIVNQTVVIVGGTLCLGEDFPQLPLPFWARVSGFMTALAGIALLGRLRLQSGKGRSSARDEADPVLPPPPAALQDRRVSINGSVRF